MHPANSRLCVSVGRPLAALALGTALLLTIAPAQAEPRQLEVDLSHTSVHWMIGHGGFTKVIGQFREINSLEILFDPDEVANSSVKASIEAASLDSNHSYRDNYTRSEAFLNAREFRTIEFASTTIEKTGDSSGTMTGELTMHGVTKPVTLEIAWNKSGDHLSGKYKIDGFTARGTLTRSDFGVDAFIPWVADEVEILIQTEGHFGKEG